MPVQTRRAARRKSTGSEGNHEEVADPAKSVLGGMKGGYRLSGNDGKSQARKEKCASGQTYEIPFNGKNIVCQRFGPSAEKGADTPTPALLFTHGAGGGIANPATMEFVKGFGSLLPTVSYQGTMNLQSRVKTCQAVISYSHFDFSENTALGGRSMGARAAVVATTEAASKTKGSTPPAALVLVSYPLRAGGKGGALRDQILYDLGANVDVLFVSGDRDSMCDVDELDGVRKKMRARSWSVVVAGADHGMSLKPGKAVATTRRRTGEVAAHWLQDRGSIQESLTLYWDD